MRVRSWVRAGFVVVGLLLLAGCGGPVAVRTVSPHDGDWIDIGHGLQYRCVGPTAVYRSMNGEARWSIAAVADDPLCLEGQTR